MTRGEPHWREAQLRQEGARGSASVVAVGVIAVIMAMGLAVGWVGAAADARSRSESAADLAALAGARVDRDSRALGLSNAAALTAGCKEAQRIAAANGALLTGCARGAALSVRVTTQVQAPVGGSAVAHSRAGAASGR